MLQSPTKTFKLSGKQKRAFKEADARWNLFTGAVRSGKTIATLLLMLKRLQELPDGRRAIIGKTETTIMRNILDPLQDILGTKYISDIEGKKREATIFGKKFYCIGANDARAVKKLKGSGFQYVIGDEITTWPENFFQMLKSRIDKPSAKFDGTTNPEDPRHWLKQNFIDKENELDVFHLHFILDDNPFLSQEFKNQLRREYSGIWYQRYILGKWTKAEGVIYDSFNDENIVEDLPEGFKQFWVSSDYGTANPTVFLLIGLGVDNNLYVIDEWRHSGGKERNKSKTDQEYSEALQDFLHEKSEEFEKNNFYLRPRWIWVDPSAASFIQQLWHERNQCPALKRVKEANNEVIDGIRRLSTLIGLNNIKVHQRCSDLIEEFHSYIWDQKAQEKGEDKPVKANDHSLDALRYAINGIYDKHYKLYKRIVSR